jgi:hypothetical protein
VNELSGCRAEQDANDDCTVGPSFVESQQRCECAAAGCGC